MALRGISHFLLVLQREASYRVEWHSTLSFSLAYILFSIMPPKSKKAKLSAAVASSNSNVAKSQAEMLINGIVFGCQDIVSGEIPFNFSAHVISSCLPWPALVIRNRDD